MLKFPLLSFVVTSYNYSKYIEDTLNSIIHQTYKNIELIVVDDGSTDNSAEIIERFIQFNQDMRISFVRHETTLGQFSSMIDGLKLAQGVFVAFIDSDDILSENYAEVHVRTHLSMSTSFTTSQIIEIDENNQIHTINSIYAPNYQNNIEIKTLDDMLSINPDKVEYKEIGKKKFGGWYWAPNSSAVYRKSAIDVMLNYKSPENWQVCPDKFLFNFAHLVGGSTMIEAPLLAYRRHLSNAGEDNYICGNKKYHSDKRFGINVKNNIKIRPETIKFIFENRQIFKEKFGTRGYINMLLKVMFN
jgi:glycosyltransferase involved in cell wall biosynthesis